MGDSSPCYNGFDVPSPYTVTFIEIGMIKKDWIAILCS
jgi:hypothetical protein